MVQLVNGVVNIITARQLKKITESQAELRNQENALQAEQWESVIVKFSDIIDQTNTMEDANQLRFEEIMDHLDAIPYPEKATKKRGPYKPRQKKGIEHKKTPSNE